MNTPCPTCCSELWPLEFLSLHVYLRHGRKIALYGCRYTTIFRVVLSIFEFPVCVWPCDIYWESENKIGDLHAGSTGVLVGDNDIKF